jgi:hypothetical protein
MSPERGAEDDGNMATGEVSPGIGGFPCVLGDVSGSWRDAEDDLLAKIGATVPYPARTWNYWLGGKDCYPVDKQVGDEAADLFPPIVDSIRALEYFTTRVVQVLAAEEGVRQFLDVGCGMPPPSGDAVHKIAWRAAPGAGVVHADSDHCKSGCAHDHWASRAACNEHENGSAQSTPERLRP